jgi:hypothetical protein
MFYTLHRLVKGAFWMLICAGIYWAWLQREALEPVYVWHDVYKNGGIDRTDPLPTISGKGLHVLDGHTFQLLRNKHVYSVRLTGLEIPEAPLTPAQIAIEKARREFLRGAVISNQVHVEVTYSNMNSLLGVVYVGKTNLNTHFITNDLGRFNGDYVKTVPRDVQYKFFSAARAHRKWREARAETVAMKN